MTRSVAAVACAIVLGATAAGAQSNVFTSVFRFPGTAPLNFAGKKVAAVVIVDDNGLRVSAEEALASEITTLGPVGVAAYRIIPREELADKDRAKGWLDRAGVEGAVTMRLVDVTKRQVYSSVVWSSGYYGDFWNYYGNAWGSVYPIGKAGTETTIAVETVVYDVARGTPVWGGVSETTNPKDVGNFMKKLVKDIVKQLQKEGLVRKEPVS